jgi:hypothetical protein
LVGACAAYLSIAVGLNLVWLITAVMWMGTEFILRPPAPSVAHGGGAGGYREGLRGSICPPSTVRRGGGGNGMQSMARFEMEVSRSLLCESTIRELHGAHSRVYWVCRPKPAAGSLTLAYCA